MTDREPKTPSHIPDRLDKLFCWQLLDKFELSYIILCFRGSYYFKKMVRIAGKLCTGTLSWYIHKLDKSLSVEDAVISIEYCVVPTVM